MFALDLEDLGTIWLPRLAMAYSFFNAAIASELLQNGMICFLI
jgi:hypothetical protein